MELHFSELTNLDNSKRVNFGSEYNNSNELNQEKYWENSQKKKSQKKVSFDDILSNMNLVVNQNGVLQSMSPLQYEQPQYYNEPAQYQQAPAAKNNPPLDASVKHSYIFNKYFKDYKDANDQFKLQPKVPKTLEEYKQMVLEDRLRRIQERNRIAQIKSTKMMFISNLHSQQHRNHPVIRASKNNLRSMNFG